MRTPKVKPQTICSKCFQPENPYNHRFPADHSFSPRLETRQEAAYRQGYEAGYERAIDEQRALECWRD